METGTLQDAIKETHTERGERLGTSALQHAMTLIQQLRPDIDHATADSVVAHLYGLADAIAEYTEPASAMASTLDAAMRATASGNTPGTCWVRVMEDGSVTFECQVVENIAAN